MLAGIVHSKNIDDSTTKVETLMLLKQLRRLFGHMLRRYHLINEINDQGDVYVKCIEMINVTDPLTKALAQQNHDGHTSSMGIRYMSDWL